MAQVVARTGSKGALQASTGRRLPVFYDDRILRAGWGILLFAGVVVLMIVLQSLFLRQFSRLHDTPHSVLTPHDMLGNLVVLLALLAATATAALMEQRRLQDYGFSGNRSGRAFFAGMAVSFTVMCALVVLLHQMDLQVFRGEVLFGASSQWRGALVWAGFFLVVAYVEESIARGYLQYTLTRGIAWLLRHYFGAAYGVTQAFWIAACLLTIASVLIRRVNSGESGMGLVTAGLFGLLMVLSLWRTGSLWWALGFHVAWDWTQSFFFGLPASGVSVRDHLFLSEPNGPLLRSGGATGPEGSVYALGALAAGLAFLLLMRTQRIYPELWAEAAADSGEREDMLPDPGR